VGLAAEEEVLELRWAVEGAVGDLLPVAESAGVHVCRSLRSPCPVGFDAHRLRQGYFICWALDLRRRAWLGDED
jgi:hypothetical protein